MCACVQTFSSIEEIAKTFRKCDSEMKISLSEIGVRGSSSGACYFFFFFRSVSLPDFGEHANRPRDMLFIWVVKSACCPVDAVRCLRLPLEGNLNDLLPKRDPRCAQPTRRRADDRAKLERCILLLDTQDKG